MRKAISIVLLALAASGCTSFTAEALRPDGTVAGRIHERGAAFVSRESGFDIEYEWLDEGTNTLNRLKVTRSTEENAKAQADLVALIARLAAQGKGIQP